MERSSCTIYRTPLRNPVFCPISINRNPFSNAEGSASYSRTEADSFLSLLVIYFLLRERFPLRGSAYRHLLYPFQIKGKGLSNILPQPLARGSNIYLFYGRARRGACSGPSSIECCFPPRKHHSCILIEYCSSYQSQSLACSCGAQQRIYT